MTISPTRTAAIAPRQRRAGDIRRIAPVLIGALLTLLVLDETGVRAATAPTVNTANPSKLIRSVAQILLSDIDAHRAEYRSDPAKLDGLVRKVVLPHFDSELAARQVLARYWDDASVKQRQRFIDAFYHFMLNDFGGELVDFSLNRLQVLPYRGDPTANYATVETIVRRGDGERIHVNYSLHRSQEGWQIYDLTFAGVSYLVSFRQDFGEEIEQKGLDELISRLEGINEASAARVPLSTAKASGTPVRRSEKSY